MAIFMNILIGLALLTVLGTLVMGTFALMDRSPEGRVKSNKMMRYRVYAQGVAIAVFALAVYVKKQSGG